MDNLPEKETEPETEETIGDEETVPEKEKEEEKILEPELTTKVDKKKLTEETPRDDESQEKGKMEQLFAHTKDVEKCTEKTVDRANEDEVDMDVDEEEKEEENDKDNKTENVTNTVRKFENMELVETENVERSDETVLAKNENFQNGERGGERMSVDIITDFRTEVTSLELKEWLELCGSVHDLSQTLTEQLRLILEPTKATKFRGDFKSGKKLNMRKIIPFIASNYRKDKIW
jgi:midasin